MEASSWLSKLITLLEQYKLSVILSVLGLFIIALGFLSPNLNFLPKQKDIVVSHPTAADTIKKETIQVDVSGGVVKPGLYQVEKGSRVNDLVNQSGGFSDKADRNWVDKNLNLALVLIDGQKVYINQTSDQISLPDSVVGISLDATAKKININTASGAELDVLPGVGPVTAKKIISGRPYNRVEDLVNKKIVGNATFEKIKDQISVY